MKYILRITSGITTLLLAAGFIFACGDRDRVPIVTEQTTPQQSPESVSVLRAFANLTFNDPVFLTWVPSGGDNLVVVEQAGKVLTFANRDSVRQASAFLDITNRVKSGPNEGLLGFAFDPAYMQNGFLFVYYSAGNPRRSVISRFSMVPGDPTRADPASEKIILQILQPPDRDNHKGGGLAFGPDGMLYIAVGDGGGAGDPDGNAQNLSNLLGKILRIDPHSGDPYTVPPDNPFVMQAKAKGEIWAYGLSNPYRFSFDPATGEMWAGDNGSDRREEIDIIVRGGNYGWNVYEGNQELNNPNDKPPDQFQPPVLDYGRDQGRSVVGGYVYHGTLSRSLGGTYVYGDYYSGKVWSLIFRDGAVVLNEEIAVSPGISSFGEDRNGDLYVLSLSNGQVYRFYELP